MDAKNKVCSKCGQTATGLMSLVATTGSPRVERTCSHCAALDHASTIHTLEEADRFIAETKDTLLTLEKVIAKCPKMPEVPEGLESVAMTPLTVYKTMQEHLAAFESRRMELITRTGSEERLEYEKRKAIEAEDYEKAAEMTTRLEKTRSNKQSHES